MSMYSVVEAEDGVCVYCQQDISKLNFQVTWQADSGANCDKSPNRAHRPV